MSMESHYYVIPGYDLTGNETDNLKIGNGQMKEKTI